MKGRVLVKKSHNDRVLVKGRAQLMTDASGKPTMLFGGGGDGKKRGKLSGLGSLAGGVLGALGPHRSMGSLLGGVQTGSVMGGQAGDWAGKKLGKVGRGAKRVLVGPQPQELPFSPEASMRAERMKNLKRRSNQPVHLRGSEGPKERETVPLPPPRVKVTKPTGPMAPAPYMNPLTPMHSPVDGANQAHMENQKADGIHHTSPDGDHDSESTERWKQTGLFDTRFQQQRPPPIQTQPPINPPQPLRDIVDTQFPMLNDRMSELPERPPEQEEQQ